MFGVSFPELLVLGTAALLVLGPDKLPGMLRTLGHWVNKLRRLTTEVRYQSGIDDVLRAEGFDGGLNELRSIMRGGVATPSPRQNTLQRNPPAVEHFSGDKSREYPIEGPDAYGALPEDLLPGATPATATLTAGQGGASTSGDPPALPDSEDAKPSLPGAASGTDADAPEPGTREIDG